MKYSYGFVKKFRCSSCLLKLGYHCKLQPNLGSKKNTFLCLIFHPFQIPSIPSIFRFSGCSFRYSLEINTWNLKITQLKRKIIFQTSICQGFNPCEISRGLYILQVGSTPHPETVTTRIFAFLVRISYKLSFATFAG